MSRQPLDGRNRQHGRAVLLTFTRPNHNLPLLEIDVFDAQLQVFLQSQSGTVQESHDDPRDPIEVLHDTRDLVAAEDDRHTNGHSSARDMLEGPSSISS